MDPNKRAHPDDDSDHAAKKAHGEKPVLYSYFRSSSSWRIRIVLAIKGIEPEYRAINLLKNEQSAEDFVKLNPSKEVPVLLIDGEVLTQSVAIMEYLEETRSAPRLLPENPADRAKVRQIVQIICSDTQPVQNARVLNYVGEKKAEWANYWIDWNFEALEKVLSETAGLYCFGDEVTLADACLVPQVFNANRYNVDMSKFPTIARINKALSDLPSFRKSHPQSQPDCPEDLKGKN